MIIVEKRLTEDEYKQTDSGLYVPKETKKPEEVKPESNSKDLYIAYKAKAEEFGKSGSSQGTTETGADWKSSDWNSATGKDKLKSWLKENKDKYEVSYIFLNEFGQEVLGMDKNLYKSCIIQYFEKTLNFKNMADVLNKLDPDFIFNWQNSIGTGLSNKNNIFFQVINKGFNSGLFKGDKSVLEFEFIGSYNICTEFQNNSGFKNYITQSDAIIYNPNLYQNVVKTDDRVKLINTDLKYEQGSVDRDILNRAINANSWKSFMSEGEEEDNNKSTKDEEDITDERYIRSSREIKDTLRKTSEKDLKYLTKTLFPKGDPKDLETLNKLFSQLKRDSAF